MPQMIDIVRSVLPYVQIILAVILTAAILVQRSEAGLGAGFGADSFSSAHHERRGFEKTLFWGTIVVAIIFVALAIVSLLVR